MSRILPVIDVLSPSLGVVLMLEKTGELSLNVFINANASAVVSNPCIILYTKNKLKLILIFLND